MPRWLHTLIPARPPSNIPRHSSAWAPGILVGGAGKRPGFGSHMYTLSLLGSGEASGYCSVFAGRTSWGSIPTPPPGCLFQPPCRGQTQGMANLLPRRSPPRG